VITTTCMICPPQLSLGAGFLMIISPPVAIGR